MMLLRTAALILLATTTSLAVPRVLASQQSGTVFVVPTIGMYVGTRAFPRGGGFTRSSTTPPRVAFAMGTRFTVRMSRSEALEASTFLVSDQYGSRATEVLAASVRYVRHFSPWTRLSAYLAGGPALVSRFGLRRGTSVGPGFTLGSGARIPIGVTTDLRAEFEDYVYSASFGFERQLQQDLTVSFGFSVHQSFFERRR